ncbi:MAG: hypothetical protein PHQ96_04790 [Candidatus Omnitrophica bacterium]|nr:hypothetical protein [Candidatus Omnitrophota bacterium]
MTVSVYNKRFSANTTSFINMVYLIDTQKQSINPKNACRHDVDAEVLATLTGLLNYSHAKRFKVHFSGYLGKLD